MQLERLVAALAPEAVLGSPDPVEVRDLAYDAGRVTPGAAFFAVPGQRADGHDFAELAVANGASTPGQIRAAVESGADDLGQTGTDPAYGKGRLNAARTSGAL